MLVSERNLVVFCVVCSIIGIAALFAVSLLTEPVQVSAAEAAKLSSSVSGGNNKLKIVGFVDSVAIGKSFATIKLAAIQTIDATSFDTSYVSGLRLKRFQEVEVYGELRNYKGQPSIIISKVKPHNSSSEIGNGCGSD